MNLNINLTEQQESSIKNTVFHNSAAKELAQELYSKISSDYCKENSNLSNELFQYLKRMKEA